MWNTQVRDITPLAGLTNLQRLDLAYLGLSDISPLASLTALRSINLKTSDNVIDLRPLRNIDLRTDEPGIGLNIIQFDLTRALEFDPELQRFNLNTREGIDELLHYLRNLDDDAYDLRVRAWRDFGTSVENVVSSRMPLAEELLQNPETGAFNARPQEIVKPDLLGATLAQVADAIDDVLANATNGLSDNSLEIRKLRRSLARYSNDPQRIEMDFTTVHGSLTRQIGVGELPASEENSALISSLLEGAQEIRATDQQVAENRRILQEQALSELSQEALKQISEAAPVLESITEGSLREQMQEDVYFLTEKMRAGPPRLPGVTKSDGISSGRDEAVRVFGRSARMLIAIRKPSELVHKLHDSASFKFARIIATLDGLVRLVLRLLF